MWRRLRGAAAVTSRSETAFDPLYSWEDRNRHWALALGGLAAIVVFLTTATFGPGLTPDSAHYFSAAESLVEGQGLINAAGEPYRFFPPGYPFLLAGFRIFGVAPATAARLICALSFAVVVGITVVLAGRLTANTLTGIGAGLLVLVSAPMIDAFAYALSEAPFLALLALLAAGLSRAVGDSRDRALLAMGVLAGLIPLFRYAGVVVIPVTAIVVLWMSDLPTRARLRRAAMVSGLATAPILIYLIRNWLAAGQLAGERRGATASPIMVLRGFVATIGDWFVPWEWIMLLQGFSDAPWALALLFLSALSTVLGVGVLLWRWWRNRETPRSARCDAAFLGLWVVFYSAFLCLTAMAVAFNPIGPRFLVPVLFPSVALFAAAAFELVRGWASLSSPVGGKRTVFKSACAVVVVALGVLQVWRAATVVQHKRADGAGQYATTAWQSSPMWAYVRDNPPPSGARSNAVDAIYLATGLRRSWSPRVERPAETTLLRERLDAGEATPVVWFDRVDWRPYLVPIGELASAAELVALDRVADGGVYGRR